MYIYLLGNGFDLSHFFPTRYENFLHVIDHLSKNTDIVFKTVGDVLSNERLHRTDSHVKDCYLKHFEIYNKTDLDQEKIKFLIAKSKSNIWFKYLLKCFNKDVNWIDFEKEISNVLNAIDDFFFWGKIVFDKYDASINNKTQYIISQFDFFHESASNSNPLSSRRRIKKEYKIETPLTSKNYEIYKEKIVDELYDSLRELSKMLENYLTVFVDNPLQKMRETKRIPKNNLFKGSDYIFTFNYTHTCELLYNKDTANHIHGENKCKIVLGINPNESDELNNINTTYIKFKKYFQRLFFKTDTPYLSELKYIHNAKTKSEKVLLQIMGHSLDKTDEDIIKEIFELSDRIVIYFHKESAVGDYIKNLISIYGKKEFDLIRAKKDLTFISFPLIEWE